MAFKESGSTNGVHENKNDGLPLRWQHLRDGCCPKCGEMLIQFEHKSLLKCTCGFKITESRVHEIINNMDQEEDERRGFNGFGYSDYRDDPPF